MSGWTFKNSSSALVPPFFTPMMIASGSLRVLSSSNPTFPKSVRTVEFRNCRSITKLPGRSASCCLRSLGVHVKSVSSRSRVSPSWKLFDAMVGVVWSSSPDTTNWFVSSIQWPTAMTSWTSLCDRLYRNIVDQMFVVHSLHRSLDIACKRRLASDHHASTLAIAVTQTIS